MRARGIAAVLALASASLHCDLVSGLSDFEIGASPSSAASGGGPTTSSAGGGGSGGHGGTTGPGTGGAGGTAGGGGLGQGCPSDDFTNGADLITDWIDDTEIGASFSGEAGEWVFTVADMGTERYGRMISKHPILLADCALTIEVTEALVGNELEEELFFAGFAATDLSMGFVLVNNVLIAGWRNGGNLNAAHMEAFDPAEHRWWRMKSAGSDAVIFQTAPDGATWTTFGTDTVPLATQQLTPAFGGGPRTAQPVGGTARFDNFNLPVAE